MDKKVLVRKLNTLKEDKDLSVFDQFNSVNEKLRAINGVLKSINIKDVKTYQDELKTLENAILSLTESVKGKDMVVNIPLDKLFSKLDQVENAIKNIKEVKIPDFPNFPEVMSLNEVQVNELLLAIQSIPEFPKEDITKLFKSLEKTISELKLEAPENEFDYDFLRTKFDSLIKAIKGISISVSGSGGGIGERANDNLDAIKTNTTGIATEAKQLPDNHNVTVSNMIAEVETGLAKEAKQDTIIANQTNGTQKTQIFDSWGDEIGSTMIDELMVSEKNRIAGGVFNGTTPDTNFYTTVVNANGTATISNSVLDTKVTADSGSSVLVYTNSLGRYIGGNMNHLRGIFRVGDTGKANNTRQIGVTYDSTLADSFYFQLSGTTFSIVANTTGLDQIKIDNGSFNGDNLSYPLTTTFHTWEILFTNKRIQFYIDKVLVHTLTETTFPICGTRHLRPFIRNANTGVGSEAHLYCQALTLLTWGNNKTQPKIHYHEGTTTGILLKYGIGSLHQIVVSGVVNNATVELYDGLNATGTKIWSSGAMTNQTVPFPIVFNNGIIFQNGLYIVKSAANCNTQTIYE